MPPANDDITNDMLDRVMQESDRAPPQDDANADTSAEGDNPDGNVREQTNADTSRDRGTDAQRGQQQQTRGNGQQRDPRQQQQASRAPAMLRPNDKGQLVDDKGNVLYDAGKQRRDFQNLRNDIIRTERERDTARAQVQAYERTHQYVREAGLKPEELPLAVNLLRDFRKDPAGTVKQLVTEMRAAGIPIELDGASIDTAAVRRMVNDATAPIREQQRERAAQEEAVANAQRDVQSLYGEFPEAQSQENSLAILVNRENEKQQQNPQYRPKSLRELFMSLQVFALRNGLDMANGDILAQVAQLTQQRGGTTAQADNKTPARRAPTVGRGTEDAAPRRELNGKGRPAPLGTSVEDRARAALREFGMNVN